MMNKVIAVQPLDDYQLVVTFDNQETRLFDVSPFLEKGIFTRLKDKNLFNQVYIAWDTVCWPEELDISPDTVYLRSQPFDAFSAKQVSNSLSSSSVI